MFVLIHLRRKQEKTSNISSHPMSAAVRGAQRRGAQDALGDAKQKDCEGMVPMRKRCLHGKDKNNCKECNPCPHGKLKQSCTDCKREKKRKQVKVKFRLCRTSMTMQHM